MTVMRYVLSVSCCLLDTQTQDEERAPPQCLQRCGTVLCICGGD